MSGTRSKLTRGVLLLAVAGAAALFIPGGHHAPELLQSDFALCTAWAAGGAVGGGGPTCAGCSWVPGSCKPDGTRQQTYTCPQPTTCSISGWETSWADLSCPQPSCAVGEWQNYPCNSCGEGIRARYRTDRYCRIQTECFTDLSCPPTDPNKVRGNWKPYGFALPGDAQYGFGYKDNEKRDVLGLAAKGNVVIGDYTSEQFKNDVLPKLQPGPSSVTQPYAVDPTDADLGYHTGSGGVMYDAKGRPLFNGDYTQNDTGVKLDGNDRRFYESSLSDAEFQQLIDPNDPLFRSGGLARIDGILYTNHAVAGAVNADALTLNGTLVSRDDVLMFRKYLYINHDSRLLDTSAPQLALPVTIKRPKLTSWRECPATGCPH